MNKYKISIGCLFMLIFFASSVFATNVDLTRESQGQPVDISYEGGSGSISDAYVINKNTVCKVNCKWYTDQGKSGNVPGPIPALFGKSPYFSITFTAPESSAGTDVVEVWVECTDEDSTFCDSSNSGQDSGTVTITWDYCGDGTLQSSYETCDGGTKVCSQLGSKYYSTKSSSCKSDCSGYNTNVCEYCGDGTKNGPEGCDSGSRNGVKCSPSYGSSCSYCDTSCQTQTVKGGYCGDGIPDSQENCLNCPDDAGCKDSEQCSTSGKCVNVVNDDNNCGSIGHKCDTISKTSETGENSCSSDYSKAIQVQKITKEQCKYKTCETVTSYKNIETNCLANGNYCQDGSCGCSEGYEVCEPFKKCVKKKDVKLNQPCKCDFQCEEGFCDETSSQCVKGLNVKISSSNSALSVGEETTVSLSVANPLNKDVEADITLSLGDGIELVEVLSGDQCSGSQCKLDKTTIPAGGKKDVTVRVKANTDTTALMNAFVNYQLGSKKIELKDKTSIKIIECGNGKIEEGETSETCCIDAGCPSDDQFYSFTCNKKTKSCSKSLHSYYLYGGAGALLLVFLIIYGIGRAVKHHKSPEREKAKKKKEAEKEEKRQEKEEAKEIKFCNKCGNKLRPKIKFCNKCGAKVKQ